jgi:uncharacterized membrane protein YfcA
VSLLEIALLAGGGFLAGTINTLAGGGSLLTVPLLVLVGVPGNVANGSNRIGVTVASSMAVWSFRTQGVWEFNRAVPVLIPLAAGSVVGALTVSRLTDAAFERAFGIVMLLLLVPTLIRRPNPEAGTARAWSPAMAATVFFAIGAYGGAFQAGIGVLLLLALSRSGLDLVRANFIKVLVSAAIAAVSIPVFALADQIAWVPAAVLAVGFAAGGFFGARLAVKGGERLIRPVVAGAVVVLAARMLGLL